MAFHKTSRSIFQYLSPKNVVSFRFQPARIVNQRRSMSFNYQKTTSRFSSGGGPQDSRGPWSDPRIRIVTVVGGFGLIYYVSQCVILCIDLLPGCWLWPIKVWKKCRLQAVGGSWTHHRNLRPRSVLANSPSLTWLWTRYQTYRLASCHEKVCVTNYRLPYSLRITHSVAMSDALCLAFCKRRI